jgi:hypothetical protein
MLQILCGLLNNNVEGSIFFGLSIDSVIEGVRLQREDKDVFRNGSDVSRIKLYIFIVVIKRSITKGRTLSLC